MGLKSRDCSRCCTHTQQFIETIMCIEFGFDDEMRYGRLRIAYKLNWWSLCDLPIYLFGCAISNQFISTDPIKYTTTIWFPCVHTPRPIVVCDDWKVTACIPLVPTTFANYLHVLMRSARPSQLRAQCLFVIQNLNTCNQCNLLFDTYGSQFYVRLGLFPFFSFIRIKLDLANR